ncbi:uncharacterized protein BCR38DRAFT_412093 [Pseudomassariella vexata]|uniref:Uncharacterized protein n=1 Tax=Pseudomassariella vexata TaxID=1141098 RepID=A0A1Y2DQS8_9PEZI|nr:uncharacterized protein BCR38DRAFT_412093 [Pseudomassariella vexata]ORY60995.1 hypothetical protein BCR38DRAFT_412093 [Pseudomassariella vexata]
MGFKILSPTTPNKKPTPCLHSDGKSTPVCWDCAEKGHPQSVSPLRDDEKASPRRKLGKGSTLSFLHSLSPISGSTFDSASMKEVHPAEPGIELSKRDSRPLSQPGLEVLLGPEVVPAGTRYATSARSVRTHDEDETIPDKNPAAGESRATICGLRKKIFGIVLACVLLLALAIVLGITLGIVRPNMLSRSKSSGPLHGNPSGTATAVHPLLLVGRARGRYNENRVSDDVASHDNRSPDGQNYEKEQPQ